MLSSRKGRRTGFSGGGECKNEGEGKGGTAISTSGDEGFERVIPAISVNECERLRYVDEARLTVMDFGELSCDDFWGSVERRPSDCSGVTRPAGGTGGNGMGSEGGCCCGAGGRDLLERKRARNPPGFEGIFPGDAGISCS
jgi:hypothetical protein